MVYLFEQFTTEHAFLFQNWSITMTAVLAFKRQTFAVCAILLLRLGRNARVPLEVNLKKETSTLLWCWPCSGKLPCFPLPTLQYQCEMFTSRIRLKVSFLRSLTLVLSMYISGKKRAIRVTNKATCESRANAPSLLCKSYPLFDVLVWTTLKMQSNLWLNPVRVSEELMKTYFLWSPRGKL